MMYPVYFLGLFVLPGFLAARLLGCRRWQWLLALPLSYSWLLLNLVAARGLGLTTAGLTRALHIELALLIAGSSLQAWRQWRRPRAPIAVRRRAWCRRRFPVLAAGVVLAAGWAAYCAWAGPYLELPADPWTHVARALDQAAAVARGDLPPIVLASQSPYWYWLTAYLCRLAGRGIVEAAGTTAALTGGLFGVAVFLFGLGLASGFRWGRWAKVAMAAAATILYGVTFGVSVFAYVRYYALAPAILNYAVYLGLMALVLDDLRTPRWATRTAGLIPLLGLTLFLVHRQEALFAVCLTAALALRGWWAAWRRRARPSPKLMAVGLASAAACAALWWATRGRPPQPGTAETVWQLAAGTAWRPAIRVAAPGGQVFQAVGLWGLWVYALAVLLPSAARRVPFLAAGLLAPLLILFNPLAVDVLLRWFYAPFLLYRFVYLAPLPYVAACLAVECLRPAPAPPGRRWRRWALPLSLVLLCLPWTVRLPLPATSRWLSLNRVPPDNRWEWWGDLVACLNRRPPCRVLADPLTGHLAKHLTACRPFYQTNWFLAPDPAALAPRVLLSLHPRPDNPWLLVVNRRDGGQSLAGRLSGHWPADILTTARFHAPAFPDWIAGRPDRFRLLWERDRIRVYEVLPAP